MDGENSVRLVLGLVGLLLGGVSLFGLVTGKAYFPPRSQWSTGPFLFRAKEPGSYWAIVIFQSAIGVLIAALPYWRR